MKGADMPKYPSENDEKDWQAESDADTLIRAEEIKADKDRVKRARAKLEERREAMDKVDI